MIMNEQKNFDKLKDELNNESLTKSIDDFVNKEIKDEIKTYQEFISYLNDKAIGDIKPIIECFDTNLYSKFIGYKECTKEIINDKIFICFEDNDYNFKAEWLPRYNYAVWQQCGMLGDDYSGYVLFPTYKEYEYFCLYFQC